MRDQCITIIISIITGIITSSYVSLIFLKIQEKENSFNQLVRCTHSYWYFIELKNHPEYDDGEYGYILQWLFDNVRELGVIITSGVVCDISPIANEHLDYLRSVVEEVNKHKRADGYIISCIEDYSKIMDKYREYKSNIVKNSICDVVFSKFGLAVFVILLALLVIA